MTSTAARDRDRLSLAFLLNWVLGLAVLLTLAYGAAVQSPVNGMDVGHWDQDPTPSLISLHRCWSGPAPADMEGKMPGHVIVTYVDPSSPYRRPVYSHRLVGKALDVALAGKHARFQVAAFCR